MTSNVEVTKTPVNPHTQDNLDKGSDHIFGTKLQTISPSNKVNSSQWMRVESGTWWETGEKLRVEAVETHRVSSLLAPTRMLSLTEDMTEDDPSVESKYALASLTAREADDLPASHRYTLIGEVGRMTARSGSISQSPWMTVVVV